jgi:DNA (cytosine-5)-methyltransferase 1
MSTIDSAGVLRVAIDPQDCYHRMLQPREQLRSQRFPDSYVVTGTKGEQTMQAGAAVSANVAQWLGEQLRQVLDGGAAR